MEIILVQPVKGLGVEGDVVAVTDGYARNYLVPQGIAISATKSNLKKVDEIKKKKEAKERKEKEVSEKLSEKLAQVSLTIPVKVGEDDRLFGSVTSQDICKALEKEGIEIDKRKIMLDEPIRELGVFPVNVKVHPEVTAVVKVWVVKE